MPDRKYVIELRKLMGHRGKVTEEQRHFARVEERAMNELYLLAKPSEEKSLSFNRTLEKYIGEHAVSVLIGRQLIKAA